LRFVSLESPDSCGRRFDCIDKILRLLRCDIFCDSVREDLDVPWGSSINLKLGDLVLP